MARKANSSERPATPRGARSESAIQRDVELAIGSEPDVVVMRNTVGRAVHTSQATGATYTLTYGLGTGSPDLVCILAPLGRWFCLELKRPGEQPTEAQRNVHAIWRRFGAFVAVVTSAEEAKAALTRARNGANQ